MTRKSMCPRCGCSTFVRSHRKFLERALLVIKPFRCVDCHHRFLTFDRLGSARRVL